MKRDIRIDGKPKNKTGLSKLRVGVLGMGFMGGAHTQAWQRGRAVFDWPVEIELTALFDMNPENCSFNGARFGFKRSTTDWKEVAEADDVDVVSICTPNFSHREMSDTAVAAGKHVWCEKPMATSLADAVAMRDAARAAGVRTMLGYNYLKSPAMLAIKALIDEGRIGEITHFNGIYAEDFMCRPDVPWTWRQSRDGAGKGALGDMGSHQVSMAIWLCGPIADLASRLQTVQKSRPDSETGAPKTVETDDHFSAIGSFQNGALFTLHTSWMGQGHKMNLAFEIVGTKGAIKFDQERMGEFQIFEMDAHDGRTNGFRTVLIGPDHPPFGNFVPAPGHHVGFNEMKIIEAGAFVKAILENGETYPSYEDGLVFERALQAIQDASEGRKWVTLETLQ